MRELKFRAWDAEDNEWWEYDFCLTKEGRAFWINSGMGSFWEKDKHEAVMPHQNRLFQSFL